MKKIILLSVICMFYNYTLVGQSDSIPFVSLSPSNPTGGETEFPFNKNRLATFQFHSTSYWNGICLLYLKSVGSSIDSLFIEDIKIYGNPNSSAYENCKYSGVKLSETTWVFELGDGGLNLFDSIGEMSVFASTNESCGKVSIELDSSIFCRWHQEKINISQPLVSNIFSDGCGEETNFDDLQNIVQNQIIIYPNPMDSNATIALSNNKVHTFTLYDHLGREVKSISGAQTIHFNRDGLVSGAYVYQISNKESGQTSAGQLIIK